LCYKLHIKNCIIPGKYCQAMQTSSRTRSALIRSVIPPCAAPAFPPLGLKSCGLPRGSFSVINVAQTHAYNGLPVQFAYGGDEEERAGSTDEVVRIGVGSGCGNCLGD
jgi:hypothetical protein